MTNPNSHSSSPSASSGGLVRTNSTTGSSTSLFDSAYPFVLSEEYRTAFGSDPANQLPASYRLAYWQKNVGDPAWLQSQENAEQDNEHARQLHRLELDKFEKRLAQLRASHEKEVEDHSRRVRAHERDLEKWKSKCSEEESRAVKAALNDALRALERTLSEQSDVIEKAVEQVRIRLLDERSESSERKHMGWSIFISLVILPTPFLPASVIFSCLGHVFRSLSNVNCRREFACELRRYNEKDRPKYSNENPYTFWTYGTSSYFDEVHSPVHFRDVSIRGQERDKEEFREKCPLGDFGYTDFDEPFTFGNVLYWLFHLMLYALPGIGALANWIYGPHAGDDDLRGIVYTKVKSSEARKARFERLAELLRKEFERPEVIEHVTRSFRKKTPVSGKPTHPGPVPGLRQDLARPERPPLQQPARLSPPAECFDAAHEDGNYVFKGAQVHGLQQVKTLAAARLFANDQVRPYFMFGGVPFELSGGSPHLLIVGTSGSGKTTAMLKLMSSLLPLSKEQSSQIARRKDAQGIAYPRSSHEWGRSLTHQAVVYNAKGEYLKYLRAFGFNAEDDLFNLDPADPNCYAWDVASDINDPDSVKKFAEQLVPMSTAASRDRQLEFWLGTARSVVEAVIVSFRNAARRQGRKPSWTLRDLVTAVGTDDSVKHILQWHDTPQQKLQSIFGLSDAQSSSIMMTLRECMAHFTIVGNRWYDAQARGRMVSLKQWAKDGAHSVLVLPNTKENVPTYGPLNQSIVKALADIFLNHEYSFNTDANGREVPLRRYMFIDEFGQAGQLGDLERLMSEGRSFGLNVVLGLHQLSQVRESYGENGSETIIGLCSYIACLKNNDSRTQKWMSAFIGSCLRSYEKKSFSYSTSQGKTFTTSSNKTLGESRGTSQSQTHGTTEGTSSTHGESSSQSVAHSRGHTTQAGHSPSQNSSSSDTKGTSTSSSETSNQSKSQSKSDSTSEQSSTSTSTGSSEAANSTTNEGQSTTRELRGEAAIEPHEFGTFPDPETTGMCEGVYITPTMPIWRSTLTIDVMRPEYEYPERLRERPAKRTHEEDEAVSRSVEWASTDLERLFLDKPQLLPAMPHFLAPRPMPIQRQMEYEEVEDSSDDDPPLADFSF